jgi:hypothetical protein
MMFILPVEVVFAPDVQQEYGFNPADKNPEWLQRTIRIIQAPQLGRPVDPWTLRTRFLSIDDTPEAAVAFLNGLGMWTACEHVYYDEFRKWKALIPRLMRLKPKCWCDLLCTHDQELVEYAGFIECLFQFEWYERSPKLVARPSTVLDAILLTISVDHARGARFRCCQDRDCGRPFPVERKGQKYCGRECCHRSVVRRCRARRAKLRGSSPARARRQ